MSETDRPTHGHVILVATPHGGGQPSYRTYLVAEDDREKARTLIARHLRPTETTYTLAAFPDVLAQIPGLEPGGVMRL